MSYLVLARKWRPQSFEDLLGQEHVCKTLTNAIHQERLAHAFLFCGPRGVGKTSAARILAKTLVCPNNKNGKPCNQCSICNEIFKGSSVDVIEIDGASNNGVDSIRELRERASYLPTQGQYKIYIIDEVHMLSQSAFNALLKILEEPPAHLKFIFATTEVHKIPATILSRCQRFDFKKIPLKMLAEHLDKIAKKENIEVEKDALLKISKVAQGSFRDALSLLDQAISFSGPKITLKHIQDILRSLNEETLFELLEKTFKKESQETFTLLSQIYQEEPDTKQIASELLEYIRSLLLIKVAPENTLELTDSEHTRLKEISSLVSLEELEMAFQTLLKGTQDMAQTLYPRCVFEMTLIRLLQLKPLMALEELIGRLETLEQHTSSSEPHHPPMIEDQWQKIVEVVKNQKPSLAALLEHGYLVEWDHQKLTIGFPKESVFYKLLSEKENITTLEAIVSQHLNTRISVTITDVITSSDTHLPNLIKNNEQHLAQLKKKALENKIIQETQKVLDGKVIDVKVQKIRGDKP